MRWTLYLLSIVACFALEATQVQPWFGRDKEFEFRIAYTNQNYKQVDAAGDIIPYHSSDNYIAASLSISPFPEWGLEIEALFGSTDQKGRGAHGIKGTVRYLWLDDIAGDCVSLITGVSVLFPCDIVFEDYSNCYHGSFEVEWHASIGKEISYDEFWDQRFWIAGFFGVANRGAPWMRLEGAWEKNWCDCHQIKLFGRARWGLGDNELPLLPFESYGSIHYAAIDAGLRYTYFWDCWGGVSFEYARRVSARNFPEKANLFTVEFMYPFGI